MSSIFLYLINFVNIQIILEKLRYVVVYNRYFITILILITAKIVIFHRMDKKEYFLKVLILTYKIMISQINQGTIEKLQNWADYIVIGAGAAGCIVAARLGENKNTNVLLIELGPNNWGNKWIETPADAGLLWNHPNLRPSPHHYPLKLISKKEENILIPGEMD